MLTSLDMAAIDPHSDAAKADWRAILKKADAVCGLFFFVLQRRGCALCWTGSSTLRGQPAGGGGRRDRVL